MEDELLEALENLKGHSVIDVVTGDIEDTDAFAQFAALKLDNGKQLTISSLSFELKGEELHAVEEGLSGLSASYGELDDFWEEVEAERAKDK